MSVAGKLLHAVDEHHQHADEHTASNERQVHPEEGRQRRMPQGARRHVHRRRDLRQARVDAAERDGHESHHVGEQDGGHAAAQYQSRGDAELRAHEGIERVVETGERNDDADGEHRAGHGIAEAREGDGTSRSPFRRPGVFP